MEELTELIDSWVHDYSLAGRIAHGVQEAGYVKNDELEGWLSMVTEFMATDKSNDWSEELAELDRIRS